MQCICLMPLFCRAVARDGRKEIHKLRQDTPSLTNQLIREQLWDDCLDLAIGEAEGGMDYDPPTLALRREDVSENDIDLTPRTMVIIHERCAWVFRLGCPC
jgi:hypothetical protein